MWTQPWAQPHAVRAHHVGHPGAEESQRHTFEARPVQVQTPKERTEGTTRGREGGQHGQVSCTNTRYLPLYKDE